MKSIQTAPKSSTNRRSSKDEIPSKTKIVAKSLNPVFSAASECDLIDSLLQSSISHANPGKNTTQEVPNPSLLDSTDQMNQPPDFSPKMEIAHGSRYLSRISGGSDGLRTENVEVQVAVDLLLQVRDRVLNAADLDIRSKEIVDALIKTVIEPSDLVAVERDRFYDRLRAKVYIGLLSFFVCVVAVLLLFLISDTEKFEFPDTILRPT